MKSKTREINVAGIQLAIFEIIWSTFKWIDRIFMEANDSELIMIFQASIEPSSEDWDDLIRLTNEILDQALPKKMGRKIVWQSTPPRSDTKVEIMSASIFRKIALEVQPSRLEAGR
jgi:hypothetical protein